MKLKIILLFSLFFFTENLFATHNLGARISARFISHYTYEITIITFTRTSSIQADRPSLDSVHLGDGTILIFYRSSKINIANDISINTYINTHIYGGEGRYLIYFIDPNRDNGIINIPNSVNVPLADETELVVFNDSLYCVANTPLYNCIPFFVTPTAKDFSGSYSAYDLDKDSLSYQLVPCHGVNNLPIPGYFIPTGVSINTYSGELTWQGSTMLNAGLYSFAVQVDKWRRGFNVGHSIEDFIFELDPSLDSIFNFINTSSYPLNPNGYFSSTVAPLIPFNLGVQYYDSSSSPMLGLISEISSSCSVTTNINGHIITDSLSWTPTLNDIRETPYTLVFRGGPGNMDLTYLVYVSGVSTDTCPPFPLISVPEIPFNENNISVFPNPVHDNLQIEIRGNLSGPVNYSLTDITGKILFNDKSFSNNKNIIVNNFSSGIYILKIQIANSVYCRKIIINK